MDKELKIKSLRYFAGQSEDNKKAKKILNVEYQKIKLILLKSCDYGEIEQALNLLEIFVFRIAKEASLDLISLVSRLDHVEINLHESKNFYSNYPNVSLQVKTIEVLSRLRYLAQESVSESLIALCLHDNNKVKTQAFDKLNNLAGIDLQIFRKIGIIPQMKLLELIETFSDKDILNNSAAVFAILKCFFASNISSHTWDYDKVVIETNTIPAADEIRNLRKRSLNIIKRAYYLNDDVSWQERALGVFQSATGTYSRAHMSKGSINMIIENTVDVLDFYESLIYGAKLQILQIIEHDSYWLFYHAENEAVATVALEVERKIRINKEYQIYRDLVGFQGVYGDWENLKSSNKDHDYEKKERDKRVNNWANSVDESSFEEWACRMLEFVKTDSTDLATFPAFYMFVEKLANNLPKLMLPFLVENDEALNPILISGMKGVWGSDLREELKGVVKSWIAEDKQLYSCCKLFLSTNDFDEELFKNIIKRVISYQDEVVLNIAVSVLLHHFSTCGREYLNKHAIAMFKELTKLENANWINEVWYRKELKELFNALNENTIEAMLDNLIYLKNVDYHAEEILTIIAEKNPQQVIEYFWKRVKKENINNKNSGYEDIPYEFHKLDKVLSKDVADAVDAVCSWYDSDNSLFTFTGGRLLKIIFPDFSDTYSNKLIEMVKTHKENNISIITAILRNYEGQPFLHGVCKELVKNIPEGSDKHHLEEIEGILESTGVVSGEYGFAESYKQKIEEVRDWVDDSNRKVKKFAKHYIANLTERESMERKRANEAIALRKYKYGDQGK